MQAKPECRLRFRALVNPTPPRLPDEQHVSFVPMEAVGERGGIDVSASRPILDVRQGFSAFRDGDVLVAKITPCFENLKGAVAEGLLGGWGYGTTELHVLRPHAEVDGRWLFYVTQSHRFRKLGEAEMYGAGGQKRVPTDFLRDYRMWDIPRSAQEGIASFLDRKTAAIDALIAKKERLIELLQEKRQALITQAVTKGLDPNVPMKDSGIEWIGEIPAHWRSARFKALMRAAVAGPYGSSLTKAMYSPEGFRVYGQQQVIPGDFDRGDYYISRELFLSMRRYEVFSGDILITVMGTVGCVAVVPDDIEPGIINPRLVRYAPVSGVNAQFIANVLRSSPIQAQLRRAAQGSTMDGLNMKIIGDLDVPVAPEVEQDRIVEFVSRVERHIAATIDSVFSQRRMLAEYRQALITAAVTGQIDIAEMEAAAS